MKSLFVAIVAVFALSACNKCVTCTDHIYGHADTKYCKGDPYYDLAKSGKMTDYNGTAYLDCR